MTNQNRNLTWNNIALMGFVIVWGFGNVVNNFANQGLMVVFSWIFMIALYFVPYALMVGELGSAFKDSQGGVSSWIKETTTPMLAFLAGWTYWVVHIPYLAQKPQVFINRIFLGIKSIRRICNTIKTTKSNNITINSFSNIFSIFICSNKGIKNIKSCR